MQEEERNAVPNPDEEQTGHSVAVDIYQFTEKTSCGIMEDGSGKVAVLFTLDSTNPNSKRIAIAFNCLEHVDFVGEHFVAVRNLFLEAKAEKLIRPGLIVPKHLQSVIRN